MNTPQKQQSSVLLSLISSKNQGGVKNFDSRHIILNLSFISNFSNLFYWKIVNTHRSKCVDINKWKYISTRFQPTKKNKLHTLSQQTVAYQLISSPQLFEQLTCCLHPFLLHSLLYPSTMSLTKTNSKFILQLGDSPCSPTSCYSSCLENLSCLHHENPNETLF